MTPEQEQMFNLQNAPLQSQPSMMGEGGVAMVGPDQPDETMVVAGGLARSAQYMAQNGPTRPIQRVNTTPKMTKAQYREQVMNEQMGYPSNLEEANRVKNLETQVSNIHQGMDRILQALNPQPHVPPHHSTAPAHPAPYQPGVAPPTHPAPPPGVDPSRIPPPPSMQYPHPMTQPPVHPTDQPTVQVVVPPSSTPPPPETAGPVSMGPTGSVIPTVTHDGITHPVGQGVQYQYDRVGNAYLPDGTPVPDPQPIQVLPPPVQEFPTGGDMPPAEIPIEQIEPVLEAQPDPSAVAEQEQLVHLQTLVSQVQEHLRTKDAHKFLRRFIAGSCNKNLSFNTWPPALQDAFNQRFQPMLDDATFISTMCKRILSFQNGHLVAPHVAGAFITVCAGIIAFTMAETG
jgi:hypothetical protein